MTKAKRKKKIAFLLNINPNKNPLLSMYLEALSSEYDLYVSAPQNLARSDIAKSNAPGRILKTIEKICVFVIKVFRFCLLLFQHLSLGKFSKKEVAGLTSYFFFLIEHYILSISHICFIIFHRTDFNLSIDAGAMSAARFLKNWFKTPFGYAIYEVYPDQFLEVSAIQRRMMMKIECKGVKESSILFDPGVGMFSTLIKRRYNIKSVSVTNILVCPSAVGKQSELYVSYPIKLYYHGLLMGERGLEELVSSMVHFDSTKVQLFIRGFGQIKGELIKIVEGLDLKDRVFFLEPLPQEMLSEAATLFDVGITLAKKTTLNGKFVIGFKTIENINAGLAILALDSFPLHKIIYEHQVGITYEDASVECITRAISRIIKPAQIESYKGASRVLSEKEFNREKQSCLLREKVAEIFVEY